MTVFKRFRPFTAPADWHFRDPDTLQDFHAKDKSDLIKQIMQFREQNSLPEIPLLPQTIENYLCGFHENQGKCEKNPEIGRSFWHVLKGGVAILKNVLVKDPVSQEVADKRSEVCLKCPYNVNPQKGRYDKWADRLAEASVPGKRARYHNQLANCEVCTCPLKVKVWVRGPFDLSKEEKEKMKKVGCWQIIPD